MSGIMNWFDEWTTFYGTLQPNTRYRVTYSVTCLNSVAADQVRDALSNVGILMTPTISPLQSFTGGTDEFQVTSSVELSSFYALFVAAFAQASETAWISCTTPSIQTVESLVERATDKLPSNPFTGLGTGAAIGIGVALIIAGAAIWVTRK